MVLYNAPNKKKKLAPLASCDKLLFWALLMIRMFETLFHLSTAARKSTPADPRPSTRGGGRLSPLSLVLRSWPLDIVAAAELRRRFFRLLRQKLATEGREFFTLASMFMMLVRVSIPDSRALRRVV